MVRKESHPDIKREKDALYVFGTNKKVNQMNNKRLKALKGEETVISAICLHTRPLKEAQVYENFRSIIFSDLFMSDPNKLKYVKFGIRHRALFSQLSRIFVTYFYRN